MAQIEVNKVTPNKPMIIVTTGCDLAILKALRVLTPITAEINNI